MYKSSNERQMGQLINVFQFSGNQVSAIRCERRNATHYFGIKDCEVGCIAVWYNRSGNISVQHKGCWSSNVAGHHPGDKCKGITLIPENAPRVTTCYCRKDLCNKNLSWVGARKG